MFTKRLAISEIMMPSNQGIPQLSPIAIVEAL